MRKSYLFAFLFITLFSILYSLFTKPVAAAGEFETSYKVLYEVSDSGQTAVTQNITLKNRTANYYADKFELKVGSTKVENLEASDSTGKLETETKFENNLTTITVKFNQKVIGIEKSLSWTLKYKSNELAAKNGQIWEISIPRLADSADISTYDAAISVPEALGPIAFSAPEPKTTSKSGAFSQYNFDKVQLTQSGISILLGEKQVFSLSLDYFLENKNFTNQNQEIALPPDNNYQRVVLTKIDPPPLDVAVDEDGNYLAKYKLTPKQQIPIKVEGYIEVFSKPFRNLTPRLSIETKKKYTLPQKYWEADNAAIAELAQKYKTPKEIYDYVTSALSYSNQRLIQQKIERKGAASALTNPKDSICVEFTDLFIAIARSAGIPAREIEGYAYTQNDRLRPLSLAIDTQDILHAWPEYWDDQLGWVQVDPTWGKTSGDLDYFNKLDFNHISFIHRGLSSTYPLPAGSYKKLQNLNKKDVSVAFAQELPQIQQKVDLDLLFAQKIIPIIPVAVNVKLRNSGSSAIINKELNLSALNLKNFGSFENPQPSESFINSKVQITILPPYSQRVYTFRFQSNNLWNKQDDKITAKFNGTLISKNVELIPVYDILFLKGIFLSLLIAAIIISSGTIFYQKTKKKHSGKKFPG